MKKIIPVFCILFAVFASGYSQNTPQNSANWKVDYNEIKAFIENKGQFQVGNDEALTQKIRFAFDGRNERYLFTPQGVVFEFIHKEKIPKTDEDKAARRARKAEPFSTEKEIFDFHIQWKKIIDERDYLETRWIGANPNPQILPSNKNEFYHSYSFFNQFGKEINENNISSFNKLTYKNIYPNIDAVYEFHPQNGIKYSLIIRPGGDVSKIKLRYSKEAQLLANGTIRTQTDFGDVIDHKPLTFYENNNNSIIKSSYKLQDNIISFNLENYDNSQTIIIDPWTQTPNFPNSNWDCVWECERDGAGNVYIIGGTSPMELRKFNAAGALQWIYNTTYDTTEWLGTFATDLSGISYVANGSPARIRSVSAAGATIWVNNTTPGGLFSSAEYWNITFNCDQTQLVIAGTGGTVPPLPFIYRIDMSNGNVLNSVQVHGTGSTFAIPPNIQEVRSITPTTGGKYYFLSQDSIGYIHQSLNSCLPQNGFPFHVSNGFGLGYKCENYRVNNSGIMALAHYNGFIFVHRGNQLQKRVASTAAVVATVPIPGGVFNTGFGGNQVGCSGIDIDDCGNVYVGSTNAVYKFDQNLVQLASYPTAFNVYDVEVNSGGEIIAAGATGTSNTNSRTGTIQSFAANACVPQTIVCCDATVCQAGPLCIDDAPLNIQAVTPGGTWSATCGACINASTGLFNPTVAGVGTHTITYTINCGSESVDIVVSDCVPLEVCLEANGNVTVSGGVGPYTWESQVTQQDCSACFVGCNLPPNCAVNVLVWTSFANGTTVTPPATLPFRVRDSGGNSFLITNLASLPPCSDCPPLSVTTSNVTQPNCNTTTGSATVSASGGVAPYTYTWIPGNLNGATQSNLAPGTYTVNVVDADNCPGTLTVTINNPPSPVQLIVTNNTSASCGSNDGSITVSATGGTSPYTYTWNTTPVQNGATANNLAIGTYIVTTTDANGCTATLSINVVNDNALNLEVISQQNVTCNGLSDGSAQINVLTGTAPFQYLWSPSGITASSASGLTAGVYTVSVTDDLGCVGLIDVTITQPSSIQITLNTTPASCGENNGSIVSQVSGGTPPYTYSWTPTGGNVANPSGLGIGNYTLSLIDNNGCISESIATIENVSGQLPIISNNYSSESCLGACDGTISIQVQNAVSYSLSNGLVSNTGSFTGLCAGDYIITAEDAFGCSNVILVNIAQGQEVVADFSFNPNPVNLPDALVSFQNNSQFANEFIWDFAGMGNSVELNPTFKFEDAQPGQIKVCLVAQNGLCRDEVCKMLTLNQEFTIYVPNAFSPNDDFKNELFFPVIYKLYEGDSYRFSIFNRWGEMIFTSNDINKGWDGKYKGEYAQPDVYVWKLEVILNGKQEFEYIGKVNIVK